MSSYPKSYPPLTEAEQKLVVQYRYLPRWVYRREWRRHPVVARLNVEEAESILWHRLCRCAQKWDEGLGFKFKTYAIRCLQLELYRKCHGEVEIIHMPSYARKERGALFTWTGHHNANDDRGPEDLPVPEISDLPAIDQDVDGKLDTKHLVRKALDIIAPRDREVIEMCVMYGRTLEEVGQKLGVSKERVRQIRNAALAKIRDRLSA